MSHSGIPDGQSSVIETILFGDPLWKGHGPLHTPLQGRGEAAGGTGGENRLLACLLSETRFL